jgi:hypothetical protein
LTFQPTDPVVDNLRSIGAWVASSNIPNILPPLRLSTTDATWPVTTAEAILCINMIHISPWASAEGLMAGAARLLKPGALLYLYGPYQRDGRHTAPSNEAFHRMLQDQNPEWGVRDLAAVTDLAVAAGFSGPDITEMPANNLSLVFRRR